MLKEMKGIVARLFLINFLILNIINASDIVVSSGSTTVDKSANGVDLVNISNPNNDGISHNDFERYNVNEGGVVINNSTEVGRSELAGLVNNNPNLTNNAKIIIAEVSGSEKSNIRGYTEIFGKEADFILANPNGIYVNGAGFINTSRVTLTSGQVEGLNGRLGFRVEGGQVEVGKRGVDLSNVNYFEIISRIAQLKGNIYGKDEVRIISGRNEYDYESKEYKEIVGEENEKPLVGIDTSQLGGIYAGRIVLVGTEKGVGVNSNSEIVADVSDVIIDVNGNVVLKEVYANRNMEVKSSNNVSIAKGTSNENINVDAIGEVEVLESLVSKSMTINSKALINEGNIEGKDTIDILSQNIENKKDILSEELKVESKTIGNKGKIIGNRYLKVKSKEFLNDGIVQSNKVLELVGRNLLNNKDINSQNFTYINIDFIENNGLITGSERVVIEGVEKLKNFNEISSNEQLEIKGQELDNKGNIVSIGTFSIRGSQVSLSGIMQGVAGEIQVDKLLISESGYILTEEGRIVARVVVENSGEIKGRASLLLEGLSLDNKGIVTGDKLVRLDMTNVINRGRIQSKDKLLIEAYDLDNRGTMIAQSENRIKSSYFENRGVITSKNSVIIEGLVNLINKNEVSSKGTLLIRAPKIDSSGSIVALGSYRVDASEFGLSGALGGEVGKVEVDKLLISQSGYITNEKGSIVARIVIENEGEIEGKVILKINAFKVDNKGIISGNNLVRLDTETLINTGKLQSKGTLSIVAEEVFNWGSIVSDGNVTFTGNNIENKGLIIADEKVVIEGLEKLVNRGEVSSQNTLSIKAPKIDSSGSIVALGSYRVDASEFSLSGALGGEVGEVEADNLLISQSGYITTSTGKIIARVLVENRGEIEGKRSLVLNFLNLSNKGIISGDKLVRVEGTSLLNSGKIQSNKSLEVEVKELENEGVIVANEDTSIKGTNFFNKGVVTGNERVVIESIVKLTNEGEVSSKDTLIIRAPEINSSGKIVSLGTYKIEGEKLNLYGALGGIGEVEVDNLLISETGHILSQEGEIFAKIFVENHGEIKGKDRLVIKSKELSNKGIIRGDKLVRLEIEDLVNSGEIEGREELVLEVSRVFENHNLITTNERVVIESIEKLVNTGEISSGNILEIKAPVIDTSGQLIGLGSYLISAKELKVFGLLSGNTGKIEVDELLVSQSGYILTKDGLLIGRMRVDNKGIIKGEDKLLIESLSINNQGIITGNKLVRLNMPELLNTGRIQSSEGISIEGQRIDNRGIIVAELEGDLKSKTINNEGIITGSERVVVESIGNLVNKGEISANNKLIINAPEIDSSGKILGLGRYILSTNDLNLSGILGGGVGEVNVNQLLISEKGYILTKKANILGRVLVENKGKIKGEEELVITGLKLDNKGIITGDKLVRLEVEELLNTGKVEGKEELNIKVSRAFENNNLIRGAKEVVVEGLSNLINKGEISSSSNLEIKAPLIDSNGKIIGLGTYVINTNELNLSGILGGGVGEVNVNKLLISQSGYISTRDGKILAKVSIENKGKIEGEYSLIIQSQNINNQGIITGDRLVRLKAVDKVKNTGRIQSKDRIELVAKLISNEETGVVVAGNNIKIQSNKSQINTINNRGIITSNVQVELKALSDIVNLGEVSSDGKIIIKVPQMDNKGLVYGNNTYAIRVNDLFNSGNIGGGKGDFTAENLVLDKTGKIMTNEGNIVAKLINIEGLIDSKGNMKIDSETINVKGKIQSESNLDIKIKKNINLQGKIIGENVNISTERLNINKNFDNKGKEIDKGIIKANKNISINALSVENYGYINGTNVNLESKKITNYEASEIYAQLVAIIKSREIYNKSRIISKGNLVFEREENVTHSIINEGTIGGFDKVKIIAIDQINNKALGMIYSKKMIDIFGGNKIVNDGEIKSLEALSIGTREIENNNSISGGNSIKLVGTNLVNNNNIISNGNLAINTSNKLLNKNTIKGKDVAINTNNVINGDRANNDVYIYGDRVTIKNTREIKNKGTIQGNISLNIENSRSIENKGNIVGGEGINIFTTSLKNEKNIQSAGDISIFSSGNVDNIGGVILATRQDNNSSSKKEASVDISSENLNNTGTITGKDNVKLLARSNLDNDSDIMSQGSVEISGNRLIDNNGRILADNLSLITRGEIKNTKEIKGNALVTLAGPSIENKELILSGEELLINGTFVNSGKVYQLNQTKGIVFKGRSLINKREIVAVGSIEATLVDNVIISDNTYVEKGLREKANIKSQRSNISLNNLSNRGLVEAYGDISIKNSGIVDNKRGEIKSLTGRVEVRGSGLDNSWGRVKSNSTVDVILSGNFNTHGYIRGKKLTRVEGNNISVDTYLESERVEVVGKDKVSINKEIYGLNEVGIKGKKIENNNKVSSLGRIYFDSLNSFINKGQIASDGILTVKGNYILNQKGVLYASRQLNLISSGLIHNKSDIISGGLVYIGGANKTRTNRLLNEVGNIEANGDIIIKSNSVENIGRVRGEVRKRVRVKRKLEGEWRKWWPRFKKKEELLYDEIHREYVGDNSNYRVDRAKLKSNGTLNIEGKTLKNYGSIVTAKNNISLNISEKIENITPTYSEYLYDYKVRVKRKKKKDYSYIRYINKLYNVGGILQTETVEKSMISAGGSIRFISNTGTLGNGQLSIDKSTTKINRVPVTRKVFDEIKSSGVVSVDENIDIPQGQFGLFKVNKEFVDTGLVKESTNLNIESLKDNNIKLVKNKEKVVSLGKVSKDLGKVESKENIDLTLGASVDKSLEGKIVDEVGRVVVDEKSIEKSNTTLDIIEKKVIIGKEEIISSDRVVKVTNEEVYDNVNRIEKREKPFVKVEPLDIVAKKRKKPSYKYMIETNVEFIDLSRYYGSNYFFERIGYNPEKNININLLGDAYYETKLVSDTIYKSIGKQYLFDNIYDDREQMKKLYDNAIAISKDMQLSIGIALSREQINKLKDDIIWLVEREVNGQIVLVPEVYLSKKTLEGSEIKGSQIVAKKNLIVKAKSVDNSGKISGNYIGIDAEEINNISAGNVQAEISADILTLIAKNNITNTGAKLKGKEELNIKAGGDVVFDTVVNVDESRSGNNYGKDVKHTLSEVSGGNVNIISEKGSVKLIGTELEAEKDIRIKAEKDLLLLAVKDSSLKKTQNTESGLLKSKTTSIETYNETIHGSSIIAGGKLNISAGNDVGLVGSTIKSKGNIIPNIFAGNNIYAVEERAESYSKITTENSKLDMDWNKENKTLKVGMKKNSTTKYSLNNKGIGSSITGINMVVYAKNKVLLVGSEISSEGLTRVQGDKGITSLESKDISTKNSEEIDEFAGLTVSVSSDILKLNKYWDNIKGIKDGLKSIGVERTKSNSSSYSEKVNKSSIRGKRLELISDEEISISGSDVAGRDIFIDAKKFTMKAAEEVSSSQSRSEGQNASIGISEKSMGEVTVGGGRDKSSSSSTVNINSTMTATRNITMNVKEDVKVSGGNIVTNTIDGDIGGNFIMESLQDKGMSKSDSESGSLSVGMGNFEGSFNTREDKSKTAWVNKQSGLVTKNGGNLKVGKSIQLKGAVIASENKNKKLNLDTKTISTEDISDDDESQSKGFGVSGGIRSIIPSISIVYGKKDKEQINKSTLSGVELSVDGEKTSAKAQGINDNIGKAQEVTKDEEKGDELKNAVKKIFKKFDINKVYVKSKYLLTSGDEVRKFLGNSKKEAESILREAMQNGKIVDVIENSLTPQNNQSYEIILDTGKQVGTKGENLIKIILLDDGGIFSAYPVK